MNDNQSSTRIEFEEVRGYASRTENDTHTPEKVGTKTKTERWHLGTPGFRLAPRQLSGVTTAVHGMSTPAPCVGLGNKGVISGKFSFSDGPGRISHVCTGSLAVRVARSWSAAWRSHGTHRAFLRAASVVLWYNILYPLAALGTIVLPLRR